MKGWLHHRSFQTRIASLVVAAVGVAVALAASAAYVAVSHQLYSQVDSSLSSDVGQFSNGFNVDSAFQLLSRGHTIAQVIDQHGTVVAAVPNAMELKPTMQQLNAVTDQLGSQLLSTVTSGGSDYRVLTWSVVFASPRTGTIRAAIQLAQSLGPVESTLATLRIILVTVMIGGLAIAIILGLTVARATLRPVKRLTAAAEHVAATQQLDALVVGEADDELGRLATAFNRMLGALGASRHQQAQLVSDAGHELRTPLTSLRTNVEFLTKARTMPEADREELLTDINAQVGELTTLVGDLVELARQDERQPEPTEVRLDLVVGRAVERARRRAPALVLDVALEPGSVRAQPALLERAVLNVVDNATKWSPPGGTVSVRLTRSDRWVLEVRDHGPGIAEEDLPKVFDRFYRAPSARAMPGSGLGLAIVSQVVGSHGGVVEALRPPDGGTLVRIELPIVTEQEPASAAPGHPDVEPAAAKADGPSPWGAPAGAPEPDEAGAAPAEQPPTQQPSPVGRAERS